MPLELDGDFIDSLIEGGKLYITREDFEAEMDRRSAERRAERLKARKVEYNAKWYAKNAEKLKEKRALKKEGVALTGGVASAEV